MSAATDRFLRAVETEPKTGSGERLARVWVRVYHHNRILLELMLSLSRSDYNASLNAISVVTSINLPSYLFLAPFHHLISFFTLPPPFRSPLHLSHLLIEQLKNKTNMTNPSVTQAPTKTICVFCGSSFGNSPDFSTSATKLGQLMASKNYGLVYGGGTTGLMGAIAKSIASNGVYVHGIIPDALVSKERVSAEDIEKMNESIKNNVNNHKGETPLDDSYGKTTIVTDMHTRKKLMGQEADAFIALPGGFGTLEELFEITTWSQLGIHQKPIILFNMNGFYDELIVFINKAIENGFISENNGKILQIANTCEEVIEKLENYTVPEGRFNLTWKNQ